MSGSNSWQHTTSASSVMSDSVIESSFIEIVGYKKFALINLSLNFCETTINDNNVILENLVAVH